MQCSLFIFHDMSQLNDMKSMKIIGKAISSTS